MEDRREFGRFLKSRRARAIPGVPTIGHRRVPGLRREEVAQLAGISVEYYVRLEQGRSHRPSDEVLGALANALALDDVEHAHLRDLAEARGRVRRLVKPEPARPELVRLLSTLDRTPALLINHRLDVLACNARAAVLFFDVAEAEHRNLARFCFLDPLARSRFTDWPEVCRSNVGQLRLAAGRHPGDDILAALIDELTADSDEFRRLWAQRDVRERTHGVKRFRHPVMGDLTLRFENFDLPGSTQRLVVFFPAQATDATFADLACVDAACVDPAFADASQPPVQVAEAVTAQLP